GRPPLLLSATAFGFAISGMHYTAMAGLTVYSHGAPASGAPTLSSDLLAIVVAIVAFLVSAVFLLFLVPERSQADASAPALAPARGRGQGRGRGAGHLRAARRRRRSAAAPCPPPADRARGRHPFPSRRLGGRRPCECALHVHFRRHRKTVLPSRHRRRGG